MGGIYIVRSAVFLRLGGLGSNAGGPCSGNVSLNAAEECSLSGVRICGAWLSWEAFCSG